MNTYAWPTHIKNLNPSIGIVLGSGLGGLVNHIDIEARVPFVDISCMKPSTAPGHTGQFIIGRLGGQMIVAQQGRLHLYEGYTPKEVTQPIRLLHQLGVRTLILSNAAGAINTDFQAGELMMIRDHINFMGVNPLIGPVTGGLERFPDMTYAYDRALMKQLQESGRTLGISLRQGVYLATTGPSYETPAEIRAFRLLGADAVGMSTVPEVIQANHLGMRVAAVSCLSNMAAGILDQRLSEEEVLAAGKQVEATLVRLMTDFISNLKGGE